jgi:20S proteasome alpha/beta subunit
MTLTICIIGKNGIVLASDSRASAVLFSNDTVRKIFRLNDYFAVGISGDGSLAMHFLSLISDKLDFTKGVTDLAEQLRKHGKEKFDEFFSHLAPKDRSSLSILLAGYTISGEPVIYRLGSDDNFVPRRSTTGFDCIGVPYIANYLLNRLYEPDISTEHAAELATFCIKETSSQDYSVGGPTQIATFSNKEKYFELSRLEIDKIEKKCEQFRLHQKSNFYPEDTATGSETSRDATRK